ncbi:MAG TPA: TolC family protein [Kofleriaceae bacterium]|jgi:outer membrane protein TolC|nr:TolC family protein [Kofleriaceae bacterium]
MTLRHALALLLLATTPVLAQPGAKTPAKLSDTPDHIAEFEKELDTLFPGTGLTAEEAARRAIRASPTVQRSVADIEIAIAEAKAAEVARIPVVGIDARYTRLSKVDLPPINFGGMTIPNAFPQFLNTYDVTARVALTVSDYFVRFPKFIEAARLGEEAARLSRHSTEVNVGQDARVAYYEWVRANLQVLVSKRQLAQVQSTVRQFRALAEAQRISRADLMRVESQEATAEQTVIQLEYIAGLREEQLRILIEAPLGERLVIGEDIRKDILAPSQIPLEDLYRTARSQRLDFKVLDTGIEARLKQAEGERANMYPKLGVFAQADYANPNQRIFPQQDEFNLTWAAGAQITWTLNDTLLSKTVQDKAYAAARGLRADRANLERGTRVELLSAQQAVAIAQAALETSKKGLAAAEESYRVRRELLNAERATAVELVDAETELTRARITALNARVDLRVAMAQLGHALGNDTK